MMKIEEGKIYRTRDGKTVGPFTRHPNHNYPWCFEQCAKLYSEDGHRITRCADDDLVAEVPSRPIIIETVKRIVPGTHNGLEVRHFEGEAGVYITADAGLWDASKLRAGAAIMTQYADALDEGAR